MTATEHDETAWLHSAVHVAALAVELGLPIIAQAADRFEVDTGDGRRTRPRMGFAAA